MLGSKFDGWIFESMLFRGRFDRLGGDISRRRLDGKGLSILYTLCTSTMLESVP